MGWKICVGRRTEIGKTTSFGEDSFLAQSFILEINRQKEPTGGLGGREYQTRAKEAPKLRTADPLDHGTRNWNNMHLERKVLRQ